MRLSIPILTGHSSPLGRGYIVIKRTSNQSLGSSCTVLIFRVRSRKPREDIPNGRACAAPNAPSYIRRKFPRAKEYTRWPQDLITFSTIRSRREFSVLNFESRSSGSPVAHVADSRLSLFPTRRVRFFAVDTVVEKRGEECFLFALVSFDSGVSISHTCMDFPRKAQFAIIFCSWTFDTPSNEDKNTQSDSRLNLHGRSVSSFLLCDNSGLSKRSVERNLTDFNRPSL